MPHGDRNRERGVGPSSTTQGALDGLDPELLRTIAASMPPNPITGRAEITDLPRFVSKIYGLHPLEFS
jgi:hypothetical protein